jgi:PPOX class probable F420-dependent enzyme
MKGGTPIFDPHPGKSMEQPIDIPYRFSPGQRAFLDAPRKAVIATLREDGTAAQSMVYYARDGDTLWISANPEGSKARDLRRDPRVSFLVFADELPAYLAIEGLAEVTDDVETPDRLELMTRYLDREGALAEVAKKPKGRPNARLRIYPLRAFAFNIAG